MELAPCSMYPGKQFLTSLGFLLFTWSLCLNPGRLGSRKFLIWAKLAVGFWSTQLVPIEGVAELSSKCRANTNTQLKFNFHPKDKDPPFLLSSPAAAADAPPYSQQRARSARLPRGRGGRGPYQRLTQPASLRRGAANERRGGRRGGTRGVAVAAREGELRG